LLSASPPCNMLRGQPREKLMARKQIWALVLIGLAAVVLIINRGRVSVDLIVTSVSAAKSVVLLASIALGVVIGILFK